MTVPSGLHTLTDKARQQRLESQRTLDCKQGQRTGHDEHSRDLTHCSSNNCINLMSQIEKLLACAPALVASVASPPCPTAVIVCVLTSSWPRDIHKVTLCHGLLQAPHPISVSLESHMRTQTRRGNRFVCRRPGAQAPSLRPCYAHVHESKSVSRAPQLSPGQTERLRPRESIHENRHTT